MGGAGDTGIAVGLRCVNSEGDLGLVRGVAGGPGGLASVGVPMGAEPVGEPGAISDE